MGRSIPSTTSRLERKLSQLRRFAAMLPPRERECFEKLAGEARLRRTAIDNCEEDLAALILLSMVIGLSARQGSNCGEGAKSGGHNSCRGEGNGVCKEFRQDRLPGS